MRNSIINYNIICILNKKLKTGLKNSGGRNFLGRVCIRGKGSCLSASRSVYRYLDFYRRVNKEGKLLQIFYDPYRTGKIGLIIYQNGLSCFMLIQKGMDFFGFIYSGEGLINRTINKGDSVLLRNIPLFSLISNIESKPLNGGSICRAACVGALLVSKDKFNSVLKLNSGWQVHIPLNCIVSYGVISDKWNSSVIGKAGKNRSLGKKPKVRGVAKNPCDHPHGGGMVKGVNLLYLWCVKDCV